MKHSLVLVFVVVFSVSQLFTAESQVLFKGSCPKQQVEQYFDAKRYLGRWYENRNYFFVFQLFTRCVTATYTDKGKGVIGVDNRGIGLFDSPSRALGTATAANPKRKEGKLNVMFDNVPFGGGGGQGGRGNYWVLDTDYDSYSIVWSCTDYKIFNTQILWILTRKRHPPPSVVKKALSIIKKRGLSTGPLEKTDQSNCVKQTPYGK